MTCPPESVLQQIANKKQLFCAHYNIRLLEARIREAAKREDEGERLVAEYRDKLLLLQHRENLLLARDSLRSRRISSVQPPTGAAVGADGVSV